MKKFIAIILCLLLTASMLTGCSSGKNDGTNEGTTTAPTTAPTDTTTPVPTVNPADVTGTLEYWTFTDSANNLVAEFNKVYPNVKVNVTVFGGDEYKTKILTTLQSGQNIPDIFDLEEGYVYEFLDSDLLLDLSTIGADQWVSDFYDFQKAGMQDSTGKMKALSFQSSPVAFWYLKDACEKWLGTSDPDQISAMLSDWTQIEAKAKEVFEKSNGKVFLWPNISEMVKVDAFSFDPLVRDGKLNITNDWIGMIDNMRTMYQSGYDAELDSWSSDWAAAWNNGTLLFRTMPSWDFFTDWDKNKGNVGVAAPFKASYEGGTFVSVYSKTANLDTAKIFLQYLASDDFQKVNLSAYNQVPASKSVSEELSANFSSENFGGQNILKTYNTICDNIVGITPDKYTRAVQNLFQKHATDGIKAGKTDDEIIAAFKAELKDTYPEVEVSD